VSRRLTPRLPAARRAEKRAQLRSQPGRSRQRRGRRPRRRAGGGPRDRPRGGVFLHGARAAADVVVLGEVGSPARCARWRASSAAALRRPTRVSCGHRAQERRGRRSPRRPLSSVACHGDRALEALAALTLAIVRLLVVVCAAVAGAALAAALRLPSGGGARGRALAAAASASSWRFRLRREPRFRRAVRPPTPRSCSTRRPSSTGGSSDVVHRLPRGPLLVPRFVLRELQRPPGRRRRSAAAQPRQARLRDPQASARSPGAWRSSTPTCRGRPTWTPSSWNWRDSAARASSPRLQSETAGRAERRDVLNVNDLANALKPVVPRARAARAGAARGPRSRAGRGIPRGRYDGRRRAGTPAARPGGPGGVTSGWQTSAGRMVFAAAARDDEARDA